MNKHIFALVPTALVALSAGCDRKQEPNAADGSDSGASSNLVESTTTVAMVREVPVDGGPDSDEASVSAVAFSVTTVATRGNPGVVEGIAMARCRREHRCGNVGSGKEHASMDDCRRRVALDWRDDLNRYECPGGIDARELNECMDEIENEDCRNPFDTLERIVACRSSDICLKAR
jgi:hypothetical protein